MEELLKDFKSYKQNACGLSVDNTLKKYLRYVREFCTDMNKTTSDDVLNAKAEDIYRWLTILQEQKHNEASTRNNKLTGIKEFYKFLFLIKKEPIDIDILNIVPAKVQKKESFWLDDSQMDALLSKITNERVKCAVAIMRADMVRYSELVQITVPDIDRGYAIVLGKGGKERKIFFPLSCQELCWRYINHKRKHIVERTGYKGDLLFISDDGHSVMSRWSLSRSLKHYGAKAGIDGAELLSPHKIRHSAITSYLQDNDVKTVSEAAGHSNIATTDRYSHTTEDRIRAMQLRSDLKLKEAKDDRSELQRARKELYNSQTKEEWE